MKNLEQNYGILERLAASWPKRAGVRQNDFYENNERLISLEHLPDYPEHLLPFSRHPLYQELPKHKIQSILTSAWLLYNQRVLEIESLVTNPAITMLLRGQIPGADKYVVKQNLLQTLIDEEFHLLMHELAIKKTLEFRGINKPINWSKSIIYRELIINQKLMNEQWQKNLLGLIWTIVSEMTINAYLNLLAEDNTIQPLHSKINYLHNKDELAHNKIFEHLSVVIYHALNPKQQIFFNEYLKKAISVFTQHDFTIWLEVLNVCQVEHAKEIIKESEEVSQNQGSKLISDVSGVNKMMSMLNLEYDCV
ncbi:diiron oxygenase [Cysteiniphilum halobium]|uniref:diiron oxygenase n=1 Tax=Cysteiniphilum halobium TaxID=2219059 RepID=UPI003F859D2D